MRTSNQARVWNLCGLYPRLTTYKVYPPCTCAYSKFITSLWFAIVHLNDDHAWGRDRVADWIDTLPEIVQQQRNT